jgi:predicted regulator of Ras-like GTPase activity (Roadblock/LC7/MglB family)
MNDHDLMVKLERISNDLVKVDGVDGSLIVDDMGNILTQRILQDIGVDLFGPMAHVITSSSKRLLNSSNQGKIQRVLVESLNGKALFLSLGKVNLIVLMKNSANVGLILVSSKRSAEKIITLTKDLKTEIPDQKYDSEKPMQATENVLTENTDIISSEKIISNDSTEMDTNKVISKDINEVEAPAVHEQLKITEEVQISDKFVSDADSENETLEILETELKSVSSTENNTTATDEIPEPEESIPIIKPPIAFPEIKKVTDIPVDMADKSDLILDIYEAIFKAMSIGASKIMGVAPARGLTQKFLPFEHCHKLLEGVNVKSNSTIDFKKIRENASKIPIEDRESQFIEDFTKILEVVTDNYGKVMGYGAFRGMVRPEFKKITDSYGPVIIKLGIANKLHPEISELFE